MIHLVVGHRHGSSSNAMESCRDRSPGSESYDLEPQSWLPPHAPRRGRSLSDPAARIFEKASEPGNGSTRCRAAAWPWRTKGSRCMALARLVPTRQALPRLCQVALRHDHCRLGGPRIHRDSLMIVGPGGTPHLAAPVH